MSVTFTAELVAPAGYVVACCPSAAAQAPRFGTYEDARDALRDRELARLVADGALPVLPGCELPTICPDYVWNVHAVYADPAPEVNVGAKHVADVLHALGYLTFSEIPEVRSDAECDAAGAWTEEFAGIEDAATFAGRVLTALALAPADPGRPGYDDSVPGGPRWHVMPRRPGYLQEKLRALHELAAWCSTRGRRVQWA